jgi:hypothetical protein
MHVAIQRPLSKFLPKNGLYSSQSHRLMSEGINRRNILLNFEGLNSHTKFCEMNCELARALLY